MHAKLQRWKQKWQDTVKSCIKTLGLYNFMRGFGWTYKLGWGHISRIKKNVSERQDKKYLRNELKLTYHIYILSYYPITTLLPY